MTYAAEGPFSFFNKIKYIYTFYNMFGTNKNIVIVYETKTLQLYKYKCFR